MDSSPTQLNLVSSTTHCNGDENGSDSGNDDSLHSKRTNTDTENSDEDACMNDPENCCCGRSVFLTLPEVQAIKKRQQPRVHYFKCSFCGTKYKRQTIYNRHFRTKFHKKNMSQFLLEEISGSNEADDGGNGELVDENGEQTAPVNLSQESMKPTPGPASMAQERAESNKPNPEKK